MDCSPPGSSVHGISPSRILEWASISYSGGPSYPGIQASSLCLLHWLEYFLPRHHRFHPCWYIIIILFTITNYIVIEIPLFPCMSKQTKMINLTPSYCFIWNYLTRFNCIIFQDKKSPLNEVFFLIWAKSSFVLMLPDASQKYTLYYWVITPKWHFNDVTFEEFQGTLFIKMFIIFVAHASVSELPKEFFYKLTISNIITFIVVSIKTSSSHLCLSNLCDSSFKTDNFFFSFKK